MDLKTIDEIIINLNFYVFYITFYISFENEINTLDILFQFKLLYFDILIHPENLTKILSSNNRMTEFQEPPSNYDEKTFLQYKNKMSKNWMNIFITQESLEKSTTDFFLNLNHDYNENCILIELLRFQLYYEKSISQFLIPSICKIDEPVKKQFLLDFKVGKLNIYFLDYFDKNPNSILSFYFWTVAFPNLFGSFISKEHCVMAFSFLQKFQDNIEIFANGALSLIENNYLFQNTFLNVFYTKINFFNEKSYEWCEKEYKFDYYEKVIESALTQALYKLNSEQIKAIQILYEKDQHKAEELILTNIILYNLKYIWPYSPLFSSNVMLNRNGKLMCQLYNDIEAKYKKDENSLENLETFLANFFKTALKLTEQNDIKLSCLLITENESMLISNFDIILLSRICNQEIYQEDVKKLISLENNADELIDFILSKAFDFGYFFYQSQHEKLFKKPYKIKNSDLENKWNNHVSKCKSINENPLSPIFNDQPFDKELAYYGLINTYHEREMLLEYRDQISRHITIVIPLKKIKNVQETFIQIYILRFVNLMKHNNQSFSDFFYSIYTTNLIKLFKQFSNLFYEYESSSDFSFFMEIYDDIFKEYKKIVEPELIYKFQQFYIEEKGYSDLLNYFTSFLDSLKTKCCESIEANAIIKNRDAKDTLIKSCKGFNCNRDIARERFRTMIVLMKKIEYPLLLSHFSNNLQKIQYSNPEKIIDFNNDGLKKYFDDNLSNFGVFSYIESVCYYLYNQFKSNDNQISFGDLFVTIPLILCMLQEFYVSPENSLKDGEPHALLAPFLKTSDPKIELAKFIFNYAVSNDKMILYKTFIQENNTKKISVVDFFSNLLSKAINEIKENKDKFPSVKTLYEQLDLLHRFI